MAHLRVESVSRHFGPTVAVDRVSLEVADGEVLALLGPSGCGKSTLLRLVAGLETPDGGRVLLDGEDVTGRAPGERDVAMVFQTYALYPHMTVEGNVSVHLRLKKVPKAEIRRRVEATAELLGLGHLLDRRPRELSGGQRQRVALARAIVREPRLFLLDEPLSNLDALLRERTRRELKLLFARLGTTVVYVTHDQSEAMTLADRIAVMREGRIEQVGTPDEIYSRPASRFVAGFVGSPAMNLLEAEVRGDRLVLGAGRGDDELSLSLPGRGGPGEWTGRELPDAGRILLGVRPEDLRLGPPEPVSQGSGSADGLASLRLPVRFVVAESLGSHRIVTVAVGGGADRPLGETGRSEGSRGPGRLADGGAPRLQVVLPGGAGHASARAWPPPAEPGDGADAGQKRAAGDPPAEAPTSGAAAHRPGAPLSLILPLDRLHVFEAGTGRRRVD